MVAYAYMQTHLTIQNTAITRELEKIDELVHHLRTLLSHSEKEESGAGYLALRKLRGALKDKLTEDPLAYQQRIRAESDARLAPME